jgi:putative tricarboxylic transport membrane protein
MVKALLAMVFGLMISTIGEDFMGVKRFTLGITELWDGIQFLSVTLGLFAISEVIINSENILSNQKREVLKHRVFIKLKEIIYSFWSIIRGGFIGFVIGVLPGAGAGIASFVSYSTERQISKNPENFGKGEIKGVAGPESANNAASAGAFVPMLALGVPGSATTAVMLGAFLMLDIQAGPMLFIERPDVVWGLVAALYVGNIFLLILNLPLISLFVRILYIPMAILLPIITIICMLGIYSSDQLTLSLFLMCLFGIIGYFMRSCDYPLAPVILGVVLGTRMEESFRQTMIMNQGNFFQIFDRPIVLIFFGLAIFSILIPLMFNKIKLDASDVD